jgi:hypothetical protein
MQYPTSGQQLKKLALNLSIACACVFGTATSTIASVSDHHEFEATLHAPFKADPNLGIKGEARYFSMEFSYPLNKKALTVGWKLELLSPTGSVVERWYGNEKLSTKAIRTKVFWSGTRADKKALADGIYQVRLHAAETEVAVAPSINNNRAATEQFVEKLLSTDAQDVITQTWEIQVGKSVAPSLPNFSALARASRDPSANKNVASSNTIQSKTAVAAVAPANGLPYTIYYGNLHSQSNHSDGGGALTSCTGAQSPQSATFGPTDAYQYAYNKGLDFLMTSEHNHMYDGSDGTNTAANPVNAKNLYQSGLAAASSFNASNPNFLGIYGMEWGVINNGGHLNILNSTELLGWETNSSGQLIADTLTAKGDYAALYTLMRQRGWIGQFNHPATTGQFQINGVPLAYSADGDQAMVLCEVLNTSAFSTNTTETETGRSQFESACNKALEAGFHIAFSTNQDNHCANWGASYTNRTGVLLANGTPLSNQSFMDALRARRVFASMDKNSQLILTANGRIMGERFSNSGSLTLTANFANTAGRGASTVAIYEGVPRRNGTVTLLSNTAITTITPTVGEHFYYAKITQDDGKMLWSAPIWVTQTAGSTDTIAPSVSTSVSGTSGNINLAATASDNIGVSKVEFYIDNSLKATSTAAPYSAVINSTTLSNGSHNLQAKAYDAANNVGSSSIVSFSVNNVTADTTPPTVSASATGSSGNISLAANASDNVGVTKVEFYVDNALKGNDLTAPFALSLDSTTLANGSHTLTAKAFDAANNSSTSGAVSFSVNNAIVRELIKNAGFESNTTNWTATSGVISNDTTQAARTGSYKAWLNGYGAAHTDTLYQQITIPANSTTATLSFWLKVVSNETTTSQAYDTLKVQIRNSSNTVLATLATYSNLNKGSSYLKKTFDLSAYKGQTIRIYFLGVEGSTVETSFLIDDVSVTAQ